MFLGQNIHPAPPSQLTLSFLCTYDLCIAPIESMPAPFTRYVYFSRLGIMSLNYLVASKVYFEPFVLGGVCVDSGTGLCVRRAGRGWQSKLCSSLP